MSFIYDKEFMSLLPPLSAEEYEKLEVSLKEHGYDGRFGKIIFWKCGGKEILIDGHVRVEICKRNNIKIGKENRQYIDFKDRNDAMDFIIRSHFTRRNMVGIGSDKRDSLEEIEQKLADLRIRQEKNYAEGDVLLKEEEYLNRQKVKIHIDMLFKDECSTIDYSVIRWDWDSTYHVTFFIHNGKLREDLTTCVLNGQEKTEPCIIEDYPTKIQIKFRDAWNCALEEVKQRIRHDEKKKDSYSGFFGSSTTTKTAIPDEYLKKFARVLSKAFHPDNEEGDSETMAYVNQLKSEWGI